VKPRYWLSALALAVLAVGIVQSQQGDERKPAGFGALEPMSVESAQAKAMAWLKDVGKADAPTTQRAQTIWAQQERSVVDRLGDTFALGDERAAKLLSDARDPFTPAPTAVPEVLKDVNLPVFFRANLALAYANALAHRTVHDEALASLKLFQPEQVVAPASYLFTRAVCEHATLQKAEATRSIARLLEDGVNSPERYRTVSALILLDMQTWKDKDLGAVARKMNVIKDRLDIARGGPQTQKLQKEVILRLDELIKELENKAKQGQGGGS
jgi:hypothetical protein